MIMDNSNVKDPYYLITQTPPNLVKDNYYLHELQHNRRWFTFRNSTPVRDEGDWETIVRISQ